MNLAVIPLVTKESWQMSQKRILLQNANRLYFVIRNRRLNMEIFAQYILKIWISVIQTYLVLFRFQQWNKVAMIYQSWRRKS